MGKRLSVYFALACATMLMASGSMEAKTYNDKVCKKDYRRLCPNTPIGQCDLASKMSELSPGCRTYVEKNK
jgi:hypothetical protein